MRPHDTRRAVAPRAVTGALALATTLSALALPAPGAERTGRVATSIPSATTPTVGTPIAMTVADRTLHYGDEVVVSGQLAPAAAGQRLRLLYAPGRGAWRSVATTTVRRDGSYRASERLNATGKIRMVGADAVATAVSAQAGSPTARVEVAARLVVAGGSRQASVGRAVGVAGALLPRRAGRRVTIEGRSDRGWRTLAAARTGADGHFRARVAPRGVGTTRLRVRFGGDAVNAATTAAAGALAGLRAALASWYSAYGGPLACGGTLRYDQPGVAHRTLPCGTVVTIRYRGRTVTAPVIDRGPYVGGREFDLTGATARALRFGGVGTIYVSR